MLINLVPGEPPDHIKLPQGLAERVDEFEVAFKAKRYRKAIELLEMIPQAYPGEVLPGHPGSPIYLPVSLFVLYGLNRLPQEIVEEYRRPLDPKATEVLKQYFKDGNKQHLEQILNQFPLSSPAVDALRILAELEFERGETLSAGFTWNHLQKLYSKNNEHTLTASLLAFAKILNGRNIEVREYLKQFDKDSSGSNQNYQKTKELVGRLRLIQTSSERAVKNHVLSLPTRRITTDKSGIAPHSSDTSELSRYLRPGKNRADRANNPLAVSRGILKVVRDGTRLTAYDKTGKRLWDTTLAASGTENEDLLQALRFMSDPVFTEDSFVVTAARASGEMESLVISFERKTGIIQWQKTIALSTDDTYLGMGLLPSTPIYQQGQLFVNTNFGIVAALRGSTGEFLWMCKYPQYKTGVLSRSIRFDEVWNYQRSYYSSAYLVISPQDAPFLYIVDVLTGQIKSRIIRESYRHINLLPDALLTLAGAKGFACLKIETAKIEWKREKVADIKSFRYGKRGLPIVFSNINDGNYSLNDGELLGYKDQAATHLRGSREKPLIDEQIVPGAEIHTSNKLRLADERDRMNGFQAYINDFSAFNEKLPVLEGQQSLITELVVMTLPTSSECSFEEGSNSVLERILVLLNKLGKSFSRQYVHFLADEIARAVIPEQVIGALWRIDGSDEELLLMAIKWHEKRKWQDESCRQHFLNALSGRLIKHKALKLDGDEMRWLSEQRVNYNSFISETESFKEWYRKNPVSTAKVEVVNIGEEFIVLALGKVLSEVGNIRFMDYRRFREVLVLDKNSGQEQCSIKFGSGVNLKGDIYVEGTRMLVVERNKISAYGLARGDVLWSFPNNLTENQSNELKRDEYRGMSLWEDRIVAVTTKGKAICLSLQEGDLLWSVDLNQSSFVLLGTQEGKAVILDKRTMNFIVLNCSDGSVQLRSKNAANDKVIFGKALRLEDSIIAYTRSQVSQGNRSTSKGSVASYSIKTGLENWRFCAEYRIADMRILPGRRIMIVPPNWSTTGVIDVLDSDSGQRNWSYRNANAKCQAFIAGKDKVYVIAHKDLESVLACIDIKTGKHKWVQKLVNSGGSYSLLEHRNLLCLYTQNLPRIFFFDSTTGASTGDIAFKGRSRLGIRSLDRGLLVFTDREIFKQLISVMEPRKEKQPAARKEKQPTDLNELFWVYGNKARAGNGLRSFYQFMDNLRKKGRFAVKERMLRTNLSLTYGNAQSQKKKIQAKRLVKEIEIDGEMKDAWPRGSRIGLRSLKHISLVENNQIDNAQWRGENDLSADLFLGWDSKHLYISVDVADDVSHSFSSDSPVWKGDGLMIAIDPDLDGGYGYNGRDYVFTQALMGKKPDKEDQEGDQGEPEGQYAVRRRLDGTGTVYEAAIPWAYLARIKPAAGTRFGFNIYITDDDSGHGASKGLVLTPGICLDRRRSLFGRGYSPELFAEVILEE